MATEEQIKEMAFTIWEKEGRPEGKDTEHYFRAKQILEEQESARVFEIAPQTPVIELAPQPSPLELTPPASVKKKSASRRKKK